MKQIICDICGAKYPEYLENSPVWKRQNGLSLSIRGRDFELCGVAVDVCLKCILEFLQNTDWKTNEKDL